MRKMVIHYAVEFTYNTACGMFMLPLSMNRESTFNKRRVTCKRCRKTKVFRGDKKDGHKR